MKIGVLSDTHASRLEDLPQAVVQGLAGMDLIIHAGDFTAQAVLEGLRTIAEVKAVRGNMDGGVLRDALPEVINFTVGDTKICVTHGWGAPTGIAERVMQKCQEADVIVFGHSHEAYNRYHGDVLLFNPGKAAHSYGILNIDREINARIVQV